MLYRAVRPLLFSLDPETAHRSVSIPECAEAARRSLLCRLRSTACSGTSHGPGLPQSGRARRRSGQERRAHRRTRRARCFGFLEIGAVTPRAQPGNPNRPVPPARSRSADQPPGLQQRRRGGPDGEHPSLALPRHSRHQRRQEFRYADRGCATTTSPACARSTPLRVL